MLLAIKKLITSNPIERQKMKNRTNEAGGQVNIGLSDVFPYNFQKF